MNKGLLLFFLLPFFLFSQTEEPKKLNILWITCEDISPDLSFYGDSTAKTPNLDALAEESIIYDHAYATTGVCAPSRSAIITGMLPTSIGTMHMRTANDVHGWGKKEYATESFDHFGNQVYDLTGNPIRKYAAVVPPDIKCFTEYLRADGYYCTNNAKTDYQFAAPQSAWDENGENAHWRHRPEGVPFFSVFNCNDTHESKIWEHSKLPLTVHPNDVKVPPYFPDNEVIRNDLARHYSNIELMDQFVGKLIQQLKEDGLYDQTVIFFYSDHGGPLPHQKREVYDSGLHVPLLIRFPKGIAQGRDTQMISFIDLAPTVLSLAGIKPPQYMEGRAFLGKFRKREREIIFATSDRFDEFTDRIRAVRNEQFLYLKNYHVDLSKYKNVSYRLKMPMMNEILKLKDENLLNNNQMLWFLPKTSEELYDTQSDPYQLHNLANDPIHSKQLIKMRQQCIDQFERKIDYGSLPESTLIKQMWPHNEQPVTSNVLFTSKNRKLVLTCKTLGASISYIELPLDDAKTINQDSQWKLYTKPFSPKKGMKIVAKASRIGFKESETNEFKN